jgi:hypothetical protein
MMCGWAGGASNINTQISHSLMGQVRQAAAECDENEMGVHRPNEMEWKVQPVFILDVYRVQEDARAAPYSLRVRFTGGTAMPS